MEAPSLSHLTQEIVVSYGNSARNVIDAYRAGSERLVDYLEQRWDSAFNASKAQLSTETRQNARAAQRVAGAFYTRGLSVATAGANQVVDQLVRLAAQGIAQASANADRLEGKTGAMAVNLLSQVVTPAAQAAGKLAQQVEQKTASWATQWAHDATVVAVPKRSTPYRRARKSQAA